MLKILSFLILNFVEVGGSFYCTFARSNMMAGGPVNWMSKLQYLVALSSMDAEYITAMYAVQGIVWILQLLRSKAKKKKENQSHQRESAHSNARGGAIGCAEHVESFRFQGIAICTFANAVTICR